MTVTLILNALLVVLCGLGLLESMRKTKRLRQAELNAGRHLAQLVAYAPEDSVIYTEPGTYRITDSIVIRSDGVKLIGGRDSVLVGEGRGPVVHVQASRVMLQGLHIKFDKGVGIQVGGEERTVARNAAIEVIEQPPQDVEIIGNFLESRRYGWRAWLREVWES